jgi:hypothetical protein
MKKKGITIVLCFLILGTGVYGGLKYKKSYEINQNTSTMLLNKIVKIGQFKFKILKVCKIYNKYKIFYNQNFLSKNYQLTFSFKDNLDRIYPIKQGKNSGGNGALIAINRLPENVKKIYMNFDIIEKHYSKDKLSKIKLIAKKSTTLPI